MRGTILILTTALLLVGVSSLRAEGPCDRPLGCELKCAHAMAVPCCCPDDYCRKPFPCLPCPSLRGCCDDYCRKPMPCVPCEFPRGCCDDYCRKPLPKLCWPVDRSQYRCGPPACRGNAPVPAPAAGG